MFPSLLLWQCQPKHMTDFPGISARPPSSFWCLAMMSCSLASTRQSPVVGPGATRAYPETQLFSHYSLTRGARCPTHLWFHQSMNQRCLGSHFDLLAFVCDEHLSARSIGRFCSILEAGKILQFCFRSSSWYINGAPYNSWFDPVPFCLRGCSIKSWIALQLAWLNVHEVQGWKKMMNIMKMKMKMKMMMMMMMMMMMIMDSKVYANRSFPPSMWPTFRILGITHQLLSFPQ